MSAENHRAEDMLERGIQKLDVGYQVPILWKQNEPQLPDNRLLAEIRLRSLISRLKKDPIIEVKYRRAMQKILNKGYAVRLTVDDLRAQPSVYYFPHLAVKKNRWGEDIRIVYDAAAKFKGRSLNDAISSDPILQNSLPL